MTMALIAPEDFITQLTSFQGLILDISHPLTYAEGHIPGAYHINRSALTPQTFTNLGITRETPIVLMDEDGGAWAAILYWQLALYGCTQLAYLDGGHIAWQALGYTYTTDNPPPRTPAPLLIQDPTIDITTEAVHACLKNPDYKLWDARSFNEYAEGHIPGALHLEWHNLIDVQRQYRLLPLETIEQKLKKLGLTPDKTIITYCYSHHRSAFTYMILKLLAYPKVKGYSGSWKAWHCIPSLPIEYVK